MTCLLVIDSGNTAIKWGLVDKDKWIDKGVAMQTHRDSLGDVWGKIPEPSQVTISNVAGSLAEQSLMLIFKQLQWTAKVNWAFSKSDQCGVKNYYDIPSQLGSDRWAALIAAWSMKQQACLVVCVGTTMTVDILSNQGEFMGGIILPGFDLMQSTLINQTALLTDSSNGCFQKVPRNTQDAMVSGAIYGLTGAIEQMYSIFTKSLSHSNPKCIISGKGAQAVLPYIDIAGKEWVDDLVLEGLRIISLTDSSAIFT